MKIQFIHRFEGIISLKNLLLAWQEFLNGKRGRLDVQEFEFNLMDNILSLHRDLASGYYCHGNYEGFFVNDPKRRHIHKASVRDRLIHHAVYRLLYPFFDKIFIYSSYSCRKNKGTHKAVRQFRDYCFKVSKNNTRNCWILKCDIKKFFDSINHQVLINILKEYIPDKNIIELLENIINSFHSENSLVAGLPLGNLTSQLFSNVYMNVFDQFVKHKLKAKYYIRYADDFVIVHQNKEYLENILIKIAEFLRTELLLQLHPNKVEIRKFSQGIDFLGYVILPYHIVLRTKTKKRMFRKLKEKQQLLLKDKINKENFNQVLQSYLGILKHCHGYNLEKELLQQLPK